MDEIEVQEIDSNQFDDIEDKKEFVSNEINRSALYEHLAEEASELAQAALKVARIQRGENPCGTEIEEALDNMVEEFTDVMLVSDIIGYEKNETIYAYKLNRWVDRILAKQHLA